MSDSIFPIKGKRIWVAGHRGMVGSAVVRRLENENCQIITAGRDVVDLTRQTQVEDWMAEEQPDAVIVAAAKVGGILANDSYPADFLYDNLMIEANIISAAHRLDINRMLFLGSSCIYPKMAPQPIAEDALLTGPLEPTNEWYAIAKIAGIKMCQAYRKQFGRSYISAMPTNLYGPGDNFDLNSSHVIPALIVKAHNAKLQGTDFTVWGSGKPLREFLHVDDLADALVYLLGHYDGFEHINVGSGIDLPIGELAKLIAEIVGFEGKIVFDTSKPDGTPRKLMDAGRIRAEGWEPKIALEQGLRETYDWYCKQLETEGVRKVELT